MSQFLTDNILLILIIVISAGGLLMPYVNRRRYGPEVTPAEATRLINHENAQVVDVRKPAEFRKGHIANSINMPADVIQNRLGELKKDRPVILVDASGQTSRLPARLLRGVGFEKVFVMENGLLAWQKESMPLE